MTQTKNSILANILNMNLGVGVLYDWRHTDSVIFR